MKVPEQLLICLVGLVEVLREHGVHRGRNLTLLLINLIKEAIATVLQPDDLVDLRELLQIRTIDGLLFGVVALIQHVRVVDISTTQNFHLIYLLLAF